MAKTKKNRKKIKNKSKTIKKYDKYGNVNFISHNKYMAIRLVDKQILSSKIKRSKLSKKKKELLPYINEEYKTRIKKLIKNKKNFSNLRKKISKKISYKNSEKYIDNLSIKKIEELYDYLLNLEKPIKKNNIPK